MTLHLHHVENWRQCPDCRLLIAGPHDIMWHRCELGACPLSNQAVRDSCIRQGSVKVLDAWRYGDRIDENGMYQEDLPEWPALEEVSRWRRWRARLRVWWRRFRHGPQV